MNFNIDYQKGGLDQLNASEIIITNYQSFICATSHLTSMFAGIVCTHYFSFSCCISPVCFNLVVTGNSVEENHMYLKTASECFVFLVKERVTYRC